MRPLPNQAPSPRIAFPARGSHAPGLLSVRFPYWPVVPAHPPPTVGALGETLLRETQQMKRILSSGAHREGREAQSSYLMCSCRAVGPLQLLR